jgi:site-specific DNA-methyltransferase (adenine-specific)
MAIDLRQGDWRTVLADVSSVDALICDPPYSARTHAGSDAAVNRTSDSAERQVLAYQAWGPEDVAVFVSAWSPRVNSWMACLTDDLLIPAWRQAYRDAGRYDFAPVPVIQHKPRLSGDGPASACVYLIVSRPREARFMQWGSLPGWYQSRPEHRKGVQGAKPLDLMRALVLDYTRPGDLVCDPCAGSATTLLAAAIECRRAVGAEIDAATYQIAMARIAEGYTPAALYAPQPEQSSLLESA